MTNASITSFMSGNSDLVTAIAIFTVAVVAARLVDWMIGRHAKPMAGAVVRGELSRITITRLRLTRRLIFAAIVSVGLGLALNQLSDLRPLATGLLASSALVGVVLGFAARQTIANAVAGVMLAIARPIRIGDLIELEGLRGRVEDITLTYTFIGLPSGRRLIVPNERVAAGPLQNFTLGDPGVTASCSLWTRPDHARPALDLLRESLGDTDVVVGQVEESRVELRLELAVAADDETRELAALRERALRALDAAGLLPGDTL